MIVSIESRFGLLVQRAIEQADPRGSDPLLGFLREHAALWPYYLHLPFGQTVVPPAGTVKEPVVIAVVRQGRWMTACPFCTSWQHASSTEHWFFCAACMNGLVGNLAVPVVWPEEAGEIEAVLLERPFIVNRNWEPHETVDDLRRENDLYLNLPAGAF